MVIGQAWSDSLILGLSPRPILGSTNASPIVVSVDQASFWLNGVSNVAIGGHYTNAAANFTSAPQAISNIISTGFTLTGSTGSGVGTVDGGFVQQILDARGGSIYVFVSGGYNSNHPYFIFTNSSPTSPILDRWIFTDPGIVIPITWQDTPSGSAAWFKMALSIAQVNTFADIQPRRLFCEAWFVDTSGNPQPYLRFQIPISG